MDMDMDISEPHTVQLTEIKSDDFLGEGFPTFFPEKSMGGNVDSTDGEHTCTTNF